MSAASPWTPELLRAEQFAQRPDRPYPDELVRGKILPMSIPKPRRGRMVF
jgi:hypothetical protein